MIIPAFPSTLTNGTPNDANQVMVLLNWIRNNVNANAPELSDVALLDVTNVFLDPQVVPDATAQSHAVNAGQVMFNELDYDEDVGGADAYEVAPAVAWTSYVEGGVIHMKVGFGNSNTGPSTIAVSGLATKAIINQDGSALQANAMVAASVYTMIYNGADFVLQGTPNTVPTQSVNDNSTKAASTAYADRAGFVGGYRLVGLTGVNNSGAPNSQFDVAANQVVLRNPSTGQTYTRTNTGTLTNNLGTAGPAAGGRDQAGGFSNNSWVHLYFIFNPTTSTLSTVSSTVAPTTGPTLPTDYTAWAYIGAIRVDGSGNIKRTYLRGDKAFYAEQQQTVATGSATTETAVDVAAFVPPNAVDFDLGVYYGYRQAITGSDGINLRVLTTVNFRQLLVTTTSTDVFQAYDDCDLTLPNVGQNYYYLWTAARTGRTSDQYITAYRVPNGA